LEEDDEELDEESELDPLDSFFFFESPFSEEDESEESEPLSAEPPFFFLP
jgi:hypothetical protein